MVNTLADRLAKKRAEALLYGLGDTVAEAKTEKLYKTLSNIKAKRMARTLDKIRHYAIWRSSQW